MFKFVMTKNSNELFHRAILHNDISRTKLILEEAMKDPRFNIDDINDEGLTALQFSCFAGNVEIVKILVHFGANWKIRDRDGYTLLHASAMAGNAEVVKYLLRVGIKPIVKTDDGNMAIDVTDEVSIIVILLRSMLDQGYLQEMQDYMMDHPKLKRNIFKELEEVKCREKERHEILKDLPYTSHTSPRGKPPHMEKSRNQDNRGRSRSTFSELSDSMQNLDKLVKEPNDRNNNHYDHTQVDILPRIREEYIDMQNAARLKRQNSTSSNSSHGSRSSHNSSGSGGGILRTENYNPTQRYLENRFPVNSSKSVTFDLDRNPSSQRAYSDGYISDTGNENTMNHQRVATVSRSSSVSSHSSTHTDGYSESCSSFDFQKVDEEPIYENVQTLIQADLPPIEENHYENFPLKNVPPPLPPRIPNTTSTGTYEGNISDRQLGSETDSGIDIDEAAGRMFALSVDDRQDQDVYPGQSQDYYNKSSNYSRPMGLFVGQGSVAQVRQPTADVNLPCEFFIRPSNGVNSKYRSWNGRTLLQEQHAQLAPYASHRRKTTRDDCDVYNNTHPVAVYSNCPYIDNYNSPHTEQYNEPDYNDYHNYNNGDRDIREYNFDHQPEIML